MPILGRSPTSARRRSALTIGLRQIVFSHGCDPWSASLSSVLGVVAMATLYGPLTHALSYHGALAATGIGATLWAAGPLIALWRARILRRGSSRRNP